MGGADGEVAPDARKKKKKEKEEAVPVSDRPDGSTRTTGEGTAHSRRGGTQTENRSGNTNLLYYPCTDPEDPTDVAMSEACGKLEVGEFGKITITRSKKNVYRIGDLKKVYCTVGEDEAAGSLLVRVGADHLAFDEFMRHLNLAA